MDKEHTNGQMENNTKVTGMKANNMESANTLIKKANLKLVNGNMANLPNGFNMMS